jgi:hypothetical protein
VIVLSFSLAFALNGKRPRTRYMIHCARDVSLMVERPTLHHLPVDGCEHCILQHDDDEGDERIVRFTGTQCTWTEVP